MASARIRIAGALALSLALLAGCTSIGKDPAPGDWPQLAVIEKRMDIFPLMRQCYAATPVWMKLLGGVTVACATVNLSEMSCTMYVHTDAGPGDPNYEHELAHCTGKDHATDATLARLWANWKRAMTANGASYTYVRNDGQLVTLRDAPAISLAPPDLR
jgi:hypothetical protein